MVWSSRALIVVGGVLLAGLMFLFELEKASAQRFRGVYPGKRETVVPPLNNVPPSLPLTPATPGLPPRV